MATKYNSYKEMLVDTNKRVEEGGTGGGDTYNEEIIYSGIIGSGNYTLLKSLLDYNTIIIGLTDSVFIDTETRYIPSTYIVGRIFNINSATSIEYTRLSFTSDTEFNIQIPGVFSNIFIIGIGKKVA